MNSKNMGKKIYYDKSSGEVLYIAGQIEGDFIPTTTEKDFTIIPALKNKTKEEVDVILTAYGEYDTEFTFATKVKVNLGTLKPEFDYGSKKAAKKVIDFDKLEKRIERLEKVISDIYGGSGGTECIDKIFKDVILTRKGQYPSLTLDEVFNMYPAISTIQKEHIKELIKNEQ